MYEYIDMHIYTTLSLSISPHTNINTRARDVYININFAKRYIFMNEHYNMKSCILVIF